MKYKGIELEVITKVQAFEEPREMLVWNDGFDEPIKSTVYAIINKSDHKVYASCGWRHYCAEIPKPTTRDMNSLETMEYLNKLQVWLNGGDCHVSLKRPKQIQNFHNTKSLIVYAEGIDSDKIKWCNCKSFRTYDNLNLCVFGILKDGKVIEFELPRIGEEEG